MQTCETGLPAHSTANMLIRLGSGGGEVSDERLIALHGAVFVVYCSSVESMPLGRQISQKQEARLCGTCWRLPTQAQRTILPKT